MKGGQCELAPLLLWDPVAKAGSKGRNVLAGREGQDDLVAEVWRAAKPKRLIGSLNRDTGASQWGEIPMLLTGVSPVGLRKAADVVEQF